MSEDPRDAIVKLQRAREHLAELDSSRDAWMASAHRALRPTFDASSGRMSITIESPDPSITRRWALLLGDAVHSIRSALDTALYAITTVRLRWSNRPPVKQLRELQFPICDKPEDLEKVRKSLPFVSSDVWDLIASVQPCRAEPVAGYPHHLSLIRDLSNADKHRLMPAVVTVAVIEQRPPEPKLPTLSDLSIGYGPGGGGHLQASWSHTAGDPTPPLGMLLQGSWTFNVLVPLSPLEHGPALPVNYRRVALAANFVEHQIVHFLDELHTPGSFVVVEPRAAP